MWCFLRAAGAQLPLGSHSWSAFLGQLPLGPQGRFQKKGANTAIPGAVPEVSSRLVVSVRKPRGKKKEEKLV